MRYTLAALAILVGSATVEAQTTTQALPTEAVVMILPATGTAQTVAPIASRTVPISQTAAVCNQPMPTAPPAGAIVNPRGTAADDPFTSGRACLFDLPTGLPVGTGYRVAVKYANPSVPSCVDPVTKQTVSPCETARVLVTANTVTIQNVTTRMSAPANVVVVP